MGEDQTRRAHLGVWDAVSIIIGIIIGATIYETPPLIYGNVSGVGMALGVWVLGGLISLAGAFCYAELATTYPRSGGDYVYLTRAYGPWMGFLFGWGQLTVIHTGGIGMLAYIFADYTHRLLWGKSDAGKELAFLFAAAAVALLTLLNILGVRMGKHTQNVLTGVKVLGLVGIVLAGLFFAQVPRQYPEGTVVRVEDERLVVEDKDKKQHTFMAGKDVPIAGLRGGSKLPPLSKEKPAYVLADLPASVPVRLTVTSTEPDKALRIEEAAPPAAPSLSFGFAMVLVMLAFSGYSDAAYVAAEVHDQPRNMPRALILGVLVVTLFYLLINAAYIFGLGFGEARRSDAIAADVLGLLLGTGGERAMCILVMVSALGAINGSILTGSRIFSSLGSDHRAFAWMRWHAHLESPISSLITQGVICLVMIFLVGTHLGQQALDRMFTVIGFEKLSWAGRGGFETLLKFTTPIFWLFFLLTSLSLFVLRERDRDIDRHFRMPFYPLLPLVFTGGCLYMLHSGMNYAGELGLVGAGLLLAGLLLYMLSGKNQGEGAES